MFEDLLQSLQATGIPFEAYTWSAAPKVDYGTLSIIGGGDTMEGDNGTVEQAIMCTCDLFVHGKSTLKPKQIQEALNAFNGIAWRLDSVQYETETRLIHWSWDVSMRRL